MPGEGGDARGDAGVLEVRPVVRLIAHTPEPDATVARAARLCYHPGGYPELRQALDQSGVAELVRHLRRAGHLSPFEHADFQFYVEGSRAMLAQLTRHRIASYSVQSLRHVTPERPEYVVPPSVRRDPALLGLYRRRMREAFAAYRELLSLGVPAEDARFLLGQGVATRLVCTFNARSLLNLFRLRCCRRAQWEIRQVAYQMLREVRRVAPVLFEVAGPPCETDGECPEGRLSCGRHRFLGRGRGQLAVRPADPAGGEGR